MGGAGTQDRAGVWITIYILVIFVFGAYRRGWLSCDDVLSEDGIARKLMDICTICCIYIRASLIDTSYRKSVACQANSSVS